MPIVIVSLIAGAIGFMFGTVFTKSSNSGDQDLLKRMAVNEGLIETCSYRIAEIEKLQPHHAVYLVTYSVDGCEPIHTIFNSKECADKMENYLRHRDDCECDYVLNEMVPVYNHFAVASKEEPHEL